MKPFLKHLFTVWVPNAVLVAGTLLLIRLNLIALAVLFVLASKWQILRSHKHGRALLWRERVKLWFRNARDNLCDITVGLNTIVLLVLTQNDPVIQVAIAATYYVWLIIIKPLTGHTGIALQAGICQFVGLTVLFLLGRQLPLAVVVAGAWLTAIVAADHLLTAYQERAHWLITFTWALLVSQLAWLFYQWLIVYAFFNQRILIPQAALVVSLSGYIFGSMYLDHMQTKLGKKRLFEYIAVIFGLLIVLIIGTRWDVKL